MSEKIFQLIAKILGVPLSSLNNDSSPENTEGWDSLKGLLLVDELEKEYDVNFTLNEIYDVVTVADIKKHLKSHGVKIDG
jgi:acyl carrier protein